MTTSHSSKHDSTLAQSERFSRAFLQTILQDLSLPVVLTDYQQRCIYLNRAAEALIGYSYDDLYAQDLTSLLDLSFLHKDPVNVLVDLKRLALHSQHQKQRLLLRRKDGACLSIAMVANLVWEGDHVRAIQLEFHDASLYSPKESLSHSSKKDRPKTEQQSSAETIAFQQSQLMNIFENSPVAIAILRGPKHIFERVNERYYEVIGRRDVIGKAARDAVPEIAEQGFIDMLDQVYYTGKRFVADRATAFIQRFPDSPPEERIVNFAYQPLFDAQGAVYGILVHVIDLTESIRAQERHTSVESRYNYLFTTVPQSIYMLDKRGVVQEVNSATEALLALRSDEIVGRHFRDFLAPEDLDRVSESIHQLLSGLEEPMELEFSIVRPSGERRLVQVAASAVQVNGQVIGVQGTSRDLTDERAREEQMQLLNMVVNKIEQGVALMDKDFLFRFANPAAMMLLGIPSDSKELFHIDRFIPDREGQEEFAMIISTLHEIGHWSGRIRRKRLKDGKVVLFDVMKGLVPGSDGHPLYFTIFQDASEAIQQEQQLRRAERLASLGTLISGVAHELNNPLTTIIGSCELLLMEQQSHQAYEDLQIIRHEAKRMARIVSDLRLSARYTQEPNNPKGPVNLNAVVKHVLKLQSYRLQTGNIHLETNLAENLPAVHGDTSQLEQILLNLVINAEHAMQISPKQGDQLLICTYKNEEGVMLEVHDTGVGIEPEYLEQLFDPFFTTKAPGEGTGLGLALVHSLVQEHGGSIHVESQVGVGTCFRVQLQAASGFGIYTPLNEERFAPPAQDILLIDDEAPIREVLARYLRGRGHTVTTASDGREALHLLKQHSYSCIISDLRMPGMDGEQLFNDLRKTDTSARLVLLTGDATSKASARLQANERIEVLFKPISPLEIARAIERPLEQER
jgi:PAS domain S-box-containing protein